ncbi:hypothetical protein N7488_002607 [Penicillium malachiteum]|nr:hypothetical protein N7488_002607 [Penicillium malachiteum]
MFQLTRIFSDDLRSICPNKHEECYIPSDDPYGPSLLLGATDALPDTVGVSERLSLISRDGQNLSPTWHYLAKHRPDKLFGYLKYAWKFEGDRVSSTESLKLLLQEIDVSQLSTCIVDLPRKCRLNEAYLPLPSLLEQSREFLEEDDAFPFLKLEDSSNEEEINSNWLFLHSVLGVKKDDDIEFLLDILKIQWIKEQGGVEKTHQILCTQVLALNTKNSSFFQSDDYIYAPNFARASVTTGVCPRWISPGLCLLQGPENLISKYPLETNYRLCTAANSDSQSDSSSSSSADENDLSFTMNLFSRVLNIKSPSLHDLIFELAYYRDLQNDADLNSRTIFDLYEYIHGMDVSLSIEDLRRQFRENSLIFLETDTQTGWYKSSECLWSSTTEIRGKVTLNDQYEDLEEFSLDTLEVQTITLQMAYDDLLEAGSDATMEGIISNLWSLNALLLTDDTYVDPKPLIQDREHLASGFRGKIKILDFTQDEVRSLKAFFDWANLSHRYLSASSKSLTSTSGDTTPFSPSPMRDLTQKAHSILRIACTFNSLRYEASKQELYKLLRTATFEVTDNIVSTLRIVQDGTPADMEETVAKLHISETSSGLTIYIPRDRKAQEICFCDILPKQLVDWLMRDPTTQILEPFPPDMLKIVIMMFSIRPLAIDSVLDREGITEVDIDIENIQFEDESSSEDDDECWDEDYDEDDDEDYNPDDNEDDSDDEDENDYYYEYDYEDDSEDFDDLFAADSTDSVGDSDGSSSHSVDIETSSTEDVQFSTQSFARQSSTTSYRHIPSETHSTPRPLFNAPSPENLQYRNLLDHVLQAARQASFPSLGAFSMAQLNQTLPREDDLGQYEGFDGPEVRISFLSDSQFERDKKVGAAGELYAFELLKGLLLPDWSDSNWPSTIRRYVTTHPDYATMTAWYGRETADIVYDDTQGLFTALLIDRG